MNNELKRAWGVPETVYPTDWVYDEEIGSTIRWTSECTFEKLEDADFDEDDDEDVDGPCDCLECKLARGDDD